MGGTASTWPMGKRDLVAGVPVRARSRAARATGPGSRRWSAGRSPTALDLGQQTGLTDALADLVGADVGREREHLGGGEVFERVAVRRRGSSGRRRPPTRAR